MSIPILVVGLHAIYRPLPDKGRPRFWFRVQSFKVHNNLTPAIGRPATRGIASVLPVWLQ
ncbi:hypothetical protein CHELA17_50055 [Chelatococcus asaccharovorans]|nr:hypothetical protein CHELA17_50055 [Chelatococcus asaccharovorans]